MAILGKNSYSNYTNTNTNTGASFPVFCKEGIESSMLRIKDGQSVKFRILPSLDLASAGVENFYQTVVPYKNNDGSLTNWVVMVKGYTFFGQLKTNFLSPATYHMSSNYPPRGCDPVKDLAAFIKFNATNTYPNTNDPLITEEELVLINGIPDDKFSKVLPQKPRVFALVNALVENATTKEWKAQVLVMPEYIFENFSKVLKQKTGRNDQVVDPNFEDFLFGDITSLQYGCVIEARLNNDLKFGNTELHASANNEDLIGYVPMPLDESVLTQRKFLHDADNVLDVKTAQEVLDLLCKDPAIPVETLQKAFEFRAFDPALSLNLDLREEGLEIMRKREERKNSEGGSFSGVKVAKTMPAAAPSKPNTIPFATAPSAYTAPQQEKPVTVMKTTATWVTANAPVESVAPAASELEPSDPPTFEKSDDDEGEIPMGDAAVPGDNPELAEFKDLEAKIAKNPAALTPDMVNRFIALKMKLNA